MYDAFALDLKVARRKSGLTQQDVAHLLGSHRSKLSHLEKGSSLPTANDIAALSLIYSKSYDVMCRSVFESTALELKDRLPTLPTPNRHWLGRFNRTNTLNNLDAAIEHLTRYQKDAA